MDTEIKRTRGRPKSGRTKVKYTLSLPASVVPLAERAKAEEQGLSGLLAECLELRYQRSGNGADLLADERAPYPDRLQDEGQAG
jgi:hypothetical protein